MKFLEYLFFKYYNWQVKVGNGDMPTFASTISIAVITMLYIADILMTYIFYFSSSDIELPKYCLSLIFVLLCVILYFFFSYKGKDIQIMEAHKGEWTGKKHLGAILFPVIAIVWFAVAMYIKMLINEGRI